MEISPAAQPTQPVTFTVEQLLQIITKHQEKMEPLLELLPMIPKLLQKLQDTQDELAALKLETSGLKDEVQALKKANAARGPATSGGASGTETDFKTTFKLAVPGDVRDSGRDLAQGVERTLFNYMGVEVKVVEARRLPPPRAPWTPAQGQQPRSLILFRVSDMWAADDIVKARRCLRNSGVTVFDHLSPAELETHKSLRSAFDEAVSSKKQAYFQRARLYVNGKEVKPAVA
jgi:hypothetical protein